MPQNTLAQNHKHPLDLKEIGVDTMVNTVIQCEKIPEKLDSNRDLKNEGIISKTKKLIKEEI